MDRERIKTAAIVADTVGGFLHGAARYTGEDFDWSMKQARISFVDLADMLGYRVLPIGEGINTGKPVVAGGV